jgi:hypothetical protein
VRYTGDTNVAMSNNFFKTLTQQGFLK